MAVPTNIKTLLSGNVVEWARIEFKETWDGEASLKTICAFANDIDNWGGGYIVIGVKEKDGCPEYPLKGINPDKIDHYLKDMLNKCKRIQPEYLPIVEVADYEDKKFIIIWAPGGYLRPYSSPKTMAKEEKREFIIFGKCPVRLLLPKKKSGISIILQIMYLLMIELTMRVTLQTLILL